MKLVVFDIDGTLTHTMGVTDALFVRVVSDVLGGPVSRDWSSYPHVTDSGILDQSAPQFISVPFSFSLRAAAA